MAKDKEEMQSDDEEELKDEEESQLDSRKESQPNDKEEELKPNDKDEEKLQFEIPVVPLIVGGVLLIVFAFAFFAWDDIKITAGVIFGSEIAEYKKECKTQCQLGNKELYCCSPRGVGEEEIEVYTCQDETLKTNCELNCRNVCFNLCKDITGMIPCAETGCTWIVKNYEDYGIGYCRVKDGT